MLTEQNSLQMVLKGITVDIDLNHVILRSGTEENYTDLKTYALKSKIQHPKEIDENIYIKILQDDVKLIATIDRLKDGTINNKYYLSEEMLFSQNENELSLIEDKETSETFSTLDITYILGINRDENYNIDISFNIQLDESQKRDIFMFQHNKLKTIKAIFIAFTLTAYSATAGTISYEYKDIKALAKQSNLSEIEYCAEHNSQSCLTLLGSAYYWGIPFKDTTIKKDNKVASNYFRKSLIESLTSRAILAVIMEKDRAIESNALLNSAATEGYYPAINRLAHSGGLKTDKDRWKSIKWRKVQMAIDPSIAHDEKGFIGAIYLKMSSPDYPNALYWLNRAITEEDDMLAERNIAKLYAEGKGVEKDYITAYMYYDLAGTAGAEEKSKLAELMTPEQVLEGLSRSHEWQDEHHSYRPGYGAWNDMGGIEWHVH